MEEEDSLSDIVNQTVLQDEEQIAEDLADQDVLLNGLDIPAPMANMLSESNPMYPDFSSAVGEEDPIQFEALNQDLLPFETLNQDPFHLEAFTELPEPMTGIEVMDAASQLYLALDPQTRQLLKGVTEESLASELAMKIEDVHLILTMLQNFDEESPAEFENELKEVLGRFVGEAV